MDDTDAAFFPHSAQFCLMDLIVEIPEWVPPPHTAQTLAGLRTLLYTRMLPALEVAATQNTPTDTEYSRSLSNPACLKTLTRQREFPKRIPNLERALL